MAGTQRMVPDSFPWCPVTAQGAAAITKTQEKHEEKLLYIEDVRALEEAPQRGSGNVLSGNSNPPGCVSFSPFLGEPAFAVGLDWMIYRSSNSNSSGIFRELALISFLSGNKVHFTHIG